VAKYETNQQALAAKGSGGEFSFQRLEETMAHRMRDEAARVAAAEEAKRAAVRAQSAGGSGGGGGGGGGAKEPSSRETKLLQEVERYKVMIDDPLHKSPHPRKHCNSSCAPVYARAYPYSFPPATSDNPLPPPPPPPPPPPRLT
jgi:hypothetical protein